MFLDCHLKPCFPVESMFLFSSFFSFEWMGSVDSLLESFPFPIFECSVGFWFGVALFCYYVSPFVCLLTLA